MNIADHRFGSESEIVEYINELIETLPRLGQVDSRMVLQDHYETRVGIFNHFEPSGRPLASVAMHPSEDYTENSSLYDALEEYVEGGYKDIWGLNITEFLNQPQYLVRLQRKITKEIMKKRIAALDDLDLQKNGK